MVIFNVFICCKFSLSFHINQIDNNSKNIDKINKGKVVYLLIRSYVLMVEVL